MPTCGNGVYRTRPGENIGVGPTCETVRILWCWCHVGAVHACLLCVSSYFLVPFGLSQPIIKASARDVCPTHGEIVEAVADPPRECAMDATTPMELSSLWVQNSLGLPSNSGCTSHISWTLWIFGFTFQRLSSGGQKPCRGCKTGENTWRTQHCRTAPQTWSCTGRTAARRVHGQ